MFGFNELWPVEACAFERARFFYIKGFLIFLFACKTIFSFSLARPYSQFEREKPDKLKGRLLNGRASISRPAAGRPAFAGVCVIMLLKMNHTR